MAAQEFPSAYANKAITLKFCGHESVFQLSHGLFSSFDIDTGTRLLLKTIAARVDLKSLRSILDVGCGVGVIGICCARSGPQAHLVLQDRDDMAAEFARENCRANGIEIFEVDCGLGFWHLEGRAFDFVASNLPAKAGKPVLEHFFHTVPQALSPEGSAGIVIVTPLEQLARTAISEAGCVVVYEEKTPQHAVFHFRRADSWKGPSLGTQDISPYLRTRSTFTSGRVSYKLETAYNLADFDTIGHVVELAQTLLSSTANVRGDVLFWNPGQGHLPVFVMTRDARSVNSVHLAARDFLELEISARNLSACGKAVQTTRTAASEAGLPVVFPRESFDFMVAIPHPVPKAPWPKDLVETAAALLRKGGRLLVAGASTDVFRVLEQARKFRVLESRKHYGCRAVLLQAP